jgi:hypothetical protein
MNRNKRGKNIGGNGHCLVWGTIPEFTWRDWGKSWKSLRIMTKIQHGTSRMRSSSASHSTGTFSALSCFQLFTNYHFLWKLKSKCFPYKGNLNMNEAKAHELQTLKLAQRVYYRKMLTFVLLVLPNFSRHYALTWNQRKFVIKVFSFIRKQSYKFNCTYDFVFIGDFLSQDSAVGIAAGYGLDGGGVGVKSSDKGKIFLPFTLSRPV